MGKLMALLSTKIMENIPFLKAPLVLRESKNKGPLLTVGDMNFLPSPIIPNFDGYTSDFIKMNKIVLT